MFPLTIFIEARKEKTGINNKRCNDEFVRTTIAICILQKNIINYTKSATIQRDQGIFIRVFDYVQCTMFIILVIVLLFLSL
jgi:hypothetical protein